MLLFLSEIHGITVQRYFKTTALLNMERKAGFSAREKRKPVIGNVRKSFIFCCGSSSFQSKTNKEVLFKDYLIYWFEEVFSKRIETTTRMVGAYVLYDLIIPNIDYDIKMRFVSVEYLDELLERVSKACASAGNKGREILNLAMKLPAITVHGIRHMFATILVEQGVPLAKISGLLGHSSVNTTFEYYGKQVFMESKYPKIA